MRLVLAAAALTVGTVSGASFAADPEAGREVFKRCAACHSPEPGRNRIGPTLNGVIGRRAGSVPGFNYSKALRESDIVWTPALLDRWLTNPKALARGNRMPFPGLPKAKDRENVIEFLRRSSGSTK